MVAVSETLTVSALAYFPFPFGQTGTAVPRRAIRPQLPERPGGDVLLMTTGPVSPPSPDSQPPHLGETQTAQESKVEFGRAIRPLSDIPRAETTPPNQTPQVAGAVITHSETDSPDHPPGPAGILRQPFHLLGPRHDLAMVIPPWPLFPAMLPTRWSYGTLLIHWGLLIHGHPFRETHSGLTVFPPADSQDPTPLSAPHSSAAPVLKPSPLAELHSALRLLFPPANHATVSSETPVPKSLSDHPELVFRCSEGTSEALARPKKAGTAKSPFTGDRRCPIGQNLIIERTTGRTLTLAEP